MQTFLPYESFEHSASVLDRQRLGKQRVECLQIVKAITQPDYGWQNHPAVNMWRGYLRSLICYGVAVCDEWIGRGYKDTCREKLLANLPADGEDPVWLGDSKFHRSHRSNLLRKNPQHYGEYFEQDLPSNLEYVWPRRDG